MERLTFEGNFCDIAQCRELPYPHDNNCTQKQVWERLKAYEDTLSCDNCKWLGKRHQKCSCCRRNHGIKDNYEGKNIGGKNMNKAVMLSIRPKWCEKIASGEKTIEVRNTKPKLETPFKCYIYCTLEGSREFFHSIAVKDATYEAQKKWYREHWYEKKGNVIGEFVCDEIIKNDIDVDGDCLWGEAQDCLTDDEFEAYIKNVNVIYGWHISALKIYDKPKELSAFYRTCPGLNDDGMCWACDKAVGEEHDCGINGEVHLSRPPQSWCYVEAMEDENDKV